MLYLIIFSAFCPTSTYSICFTSKHYTLTDVHSNTFGNDPKFIFTGSMQEPSFRDTKSLISTYQLINEYFEFVMLTDDLSWANVFYRKVLVIWATS